MSNEYNTPYNNQQPPQIIIQTVERRSNGMGKAGLALSIISLVICWVPIISWILWFLGFLFSFIGMFKSPRGTAVAGFIISIIDLIAIIVLVVVLGVSAGVLEYCDFL